MTNIIELNNVSFYYPTNTNHDNAIKKDTSSSDIRLSEYMASCPSSPFAQKAPAYVLKKINLAIPEGAKIGIIGESGCGKSTLLRLLSGLASPSEGTVSVCGETIPERITPHISMVMQDSMLMPFTIYENITFGHTVSERKLSEILSAVKLDSWISSLENGVHTYLGDRADELSGGQAQRIAIARAMVKEAPVILLDEPTSALDNATAVDVLTAIDKLSANKTVIHVTHRQEFLDNCTCVYRLNAGVLTTLTG